MIPTANLYYFHPIQNHQIEMKHGPDAHLLQDKKQQKFAKNKVQSSLKSFTYKTKQTQKINEPAFIHFLIQYIHHTMTYRFLYLDGNDCKFLLSQIRRINNTVVDFVLKFTVFYK